MYNEERATYYYQEVLKNPEIFDEHEIAHANICIALAYAMDQSHREEEWLPYAQRAFDIGSIEASTLIGRYYLVEKKEYETAKASKKKNNKTKAIIIISIIAVIVIFSILRNSIRRGHEVQSGGSGESTSGSMNDGSYGDGLSTSEVCNSFNSIVELLNMPSDQIENMLGDAYESSDNTVKYEKADLFGYRGPITIQYWEGYVVGVEFLDQDPNIAGNEEYYTNTFLSAINEYTGTQSALVKASDVYSYEREWNVTRQNLIITMQMQQSDETAIRIKVTLDEIG